MSEIYEAYSILSNKEKRRDYDLKLSIVSTNGANECIKNEKELINTLSNIQYFLTYPTLSTKSLQYYNDKLKFLTLNKQLDLLINQEYKHIDQAYIKLILTLLRLVKYETFIIIAQYLQGKLDTNSSKKLQKIKITHKINYYFNKHFALIIFFMTLIICIGLFIIVKK